MSSVLCACGCGKDAPIYRGVQCKFLRGHAGASVVRKKERYQIDPVTGCWNWLLYKRDGYGVVKVGDKVLSAHRFYYEQKYGPIPYGYILDHKVCNNRPCYSR